MQAALILILGCLFFPQEAETGFVPSVQDFDKKLAEADAYLQILIDQLKVGSLFEIHDREILHSAPQGSLSKPFQSFQQYSFK